MTQNNLGQDGNGGVDRVKDMANTIAAEMDADVLLYNAGFSRPLDDQLIRQLRTRRRRENILLLLITEGGDPDAAYRISRALQDNYKKFVAFVPGYCKSAGTLCVIGAQELVMSDVAELGPLDIQLYKKDEIGESSSGLVAGEALTALQTKAFAMYEEFFLTLKRKSQNQITFKTASEMAYKLVVGLVEPLYAQIDPIQVGEMTRSMRIGKDYGERLKLRSKNLKPNALELLLETYPSHGFVIDRTEAKSLFKNVRQPSENEELLSQFLGDFSCVPNSQGFVNFLSDELPEISHEKSESTQANTEVTSGVGGESDSGGNGKSAGRTKSSAAPSNRNAGKGSAEVASPS